MQATLRRSRPPVVSIIDDDKSMRAATNRLVRSLGFEAYTFASAEEFLLSPHLYDSSCAIVDIRMPGMSGVALQSHLKDKRRDLPIIFITAFPEDAVRTQTMDAGAIAFLSKPFDGKAIIKCLGAALKKPDGEPVQI